MWSSVGCQFFKRNLPSYLENMAVLSILRGLGQNVTRYPITLGNNSIKILKNVNYNSLQQAREMSEHHVMKIRPSRWTWNKFKDCLHFYSLLGIIPATLLIMYTNLFIGPARLVETPEDYTPKHWEYHPHPITRFIAKHFSRSYQQEYEMMLHSVYEEEYKQKLRLAEKRIREKMRDNQDYEAFYYRPATARYQKLVREHMENTTLRSGDK
nr:EOG090X0FIE [Cyclestheria hislopi]